MKNFDACLKLLLVHEGGDDDDPQDPGGRTSRGILQSEYDLFRSKGGLSQRDVWSADDSEVATLYRAQYWDKMRCDELPAGLDYCVFDYGVNSGVSRSVKLLQKIWKVKPDGVVGPETLKVIPLTSVRGTIEEMSDARLALLQALGTWGRFGHGWATRVADVRKASLAMATQSPAPKTPVPAQPSGGLFAALLQAFLSIFNKRG